MLLTRGAVETGCFVGVPKTGDALGAIRSTRTSTTHAAFETGLTVCVCLSNAGRIFVVPRRTRGALSAIDTSRIIGIPETSDAGLAVRSSRPSAVGAAFVARLTICIYLGTACNVFIVARTAGGALHTIPLRHVMTVGAIRARPSIAYIAIRFTPGRKLEVIDEESIGAFVSNLSYCDSRDLVTYDGECAVSGALWWLGVDLLASYEGIGGIICLENETTLGDIYTHNRDVAHRRGKRHVVGFPTAGRSERKIS